MADTQKFWDRIAERYAASPVSDETSYRAKLDMTRDYFSPLSEVLEIGCGTGSTAISHAPHVKHLLATDISAKMLEIARRKAEAAGAGNIDFLHVGAEELTVPDAAFDAVLAMSVLHLVEDMASVIAKAHRALKPGGVFITSTVCLADEMPYLRFLLPLGRLIGKVPEVVTFLTAQTLRKSLSGNGFVVEREWYPGRRKARFLVARKPG